MRLDDWPDRLMAAIAAAGERPFQWGGNDCLRFALGCASAITGRDELDGVPVYNDEKSARRALKRLGFASLSEALASRFAELPPALARRGDLGIVRLGDWDACAVCAGVTWAAVAMDGVTHVTRSRISRAFKVD